MKQHPLLAHVGLRVLVGCFLVQASTARASIPGEVAAARVSQASYRHYLDDMLYTHDGDQRGPQGPERALARDNIFAILSSFGLEVELDPFEHDGATYYNVVATKLGTTHPTQEYVIGAHYDSTAFEDPLGGSPGADDNASGVALVLEAARIISEYPSERTIRFIAFDLEEGPGAGSHHYIAQHIDDDILGMLNADMVSYYSGDWSVQLQAFDSDSDPLADSIGAAVTTYGAGLEWTLEYGGLSDHAAFGQAGFQACMLIEVGYWGNPYFHTLLDSVDTPDYIDYGYATQITRVAVGYLVDQAGVYVELPDADYDGDGDVDADDFAEFESCFAGADVPVAPPCDFFDLEQDDDVDCTDWRMFEVMWTEPNGPPLFRQCPPRLPPPLEGESGARCLRFGAPEHAWPMALLLTGDPNDPSTSCVSSYVQPDGGIGSDPVFQGSDLWGTVIACGESMIPASMYRLQCDFGEPGVPLLSTPMSISTAPWGDVVGNFVNGAWTPPNATVDFNDITSVVDAFKHLPTAPLLFRADQIGASGSECIPDMNIDFLDISAAVEAFKGYDYWETTSCPPPCE